MIELLVALAQGVASRPEVAGIVLLAGSMAAVVMRKKRGRNSDKPTPAFDRAQNAQLVAIKGLVVVLVVREIGKVAIILFN